MHPHPLVRRGGAFIACIGLGLLAGTAVSYWLNAETPINRPAFASGAIIGLIVLLSTDKQLSLGKPTRLQVGALWAGIALVVVLFVLLPRLLVEPDERTFWLAVLFIVGLGFVPLSIAFGQRSAMLGFACMGIAAAGYASPDIDARLIAVFDGLLTLVIGAAMAFQT